MENDVKIIYQSPTRDNPNPLPMVFKEGKLIGYLIEDKVAWEYDEERSNEQGC